MIPLMNAAGMVKSAADARKLLQLPNDILQAVTFGSITPEKRDGNGGQVFNLPLNALGMPNPGITAFRDVWMESEEDFRASNKRRRLNIAGFSADDYAQMVLAIYRWRCVVPEIEINLGCPNVRDGGAQKPIASFDPLSISLILTALECIRMNQSTQIPFAVKLSPYSDPGLFSEVLSVISSYSTIVRYVVLTNTFANASGYDDDGRLMISANDGYAGLSGPALKHIALGHVRRAREKLPESVSIIGAGGISSGRDVLDMERAGAAAVQIGTAWFKTMDPRVFQDIAVEYAELSESEPVPA